MGKTEVQDRKLCEKLTQALQSKVVASIRRFQHCRNFGYSAQVHSPWEYQPQRAKIPTRTEKPKCFPCFLVWHCYSICLVLLKIPASANSCGSWELGQRGCQNTGFCWVWGTTVTWKHLCGRCGNSSCCTEDCQKAQICRDPHLSLVFHLIMTNLEEIWTSALGTFSGEKKTIKFQQKFCSLSALLSSDWRQTVKERDKSAEWRIPSKAQQRKK